MQLVGHLCIVVSISKGKLWLVCDTPACKREGFCFGFAGEFVQDTQ
ncbi:MAG: hypothetical protein ACL7AX_12170 [Candidatus Arsenophonus phytopathogenicus]